MTKAHVTIQQAHTPHNVKLETDMRLGFGKSV